MGCNGKAVVGCEYAKGGVAYKEFGPVVFASGGFGADFGQDSLLAKYRPDLLHLPTTNGEHCTGDGIKLGEAIGAKTIDLEWVQVHPTGLVKPDDPDAKVKFLAAEALRGVGGLVLDMKGKRFANELGRRDYVTGEMWKNKPPFRLCLNKAASDEIIWHCKHYTGRGVMKYYKSGQILRRIWVFLRRQSRLKWSSTTRLPRSKKRTQMVASGPHTLQESPGMQPAAQQVVARSSTTMSFQVQSLLRKNTMWPSSPL